MFVCFFFKWTLLCKKKKIPSPVSKSFEWLVSLFSYILQIKILFCSILFACKAKAWSHIEFELKLVKIPIKNLEINTVIPVTKKVTVRLLSSFSGICCSLRHSVQTQLTPTQSLVLLFHCLIPLQTRSVLLHSTVLGIPAVGKELQISFYLLTLSSL